MNDNEEIPLAPDIDGVMKCELIKVIATLEFSYFCLLKPYHRCKSHHHYLIYIITENYILKNFIVEYFGRETMTSIQEIGEYDKNYIYITL